MNSFLFLLVAFLAVGSSTREALYKHYEVYRVTPTTPEEVKALLQLESTDQFNFWKSPRAVNIGADIMVAPHQRPTFHEFLELNNLEAKRIIEDVQGLIDKETLQRSRANKENFDWTTYHTLEEIYDWLDELVTAHNESIKIVIGGNTYEDREIKGIEIINGEGYPGVIIESGIHAREWIGPAASSWIINEIINSDKDSIWKKFNYIYFPTVNPDGYKYTEINDRLWRKTRTPYLGGLCRGADPNRNWEADWGTVGISKNPCSDIYAGPEAFSEKETKSLSEYFITVSKNYDIYIAFHSYGQVLMYPWGSKDVATPQTPLWQEIGSAAAQSLKDVNGTEFKVGNIYSTIYPASGSTLDWYYSRFQSSLTYVFECRDTNTGFLTPEDLIIVIGKEHLAAIQTMLERYTPPSPGGDKH